MKFKLFDESCRTLSRRTKLNKCLTIKFLTALKEINF